MRWMVGCLALLTGCATLPSYALYSTDALLSRRIEVVNELGRYQSMPLPQAPPPTYQITTATLSNSPNVYGRHVVYAQPIPSSNVGGGFMQGFIQGTIGRLYRELTMIDQELLSRSRQSGSP